ncbi:class I SAM-dependent DNA methyltransferase [Fructilactobacillus fructivorans]|uniref:Methyltransferase domain-containing protein n=1 Tax=Fructilactobacillus fructivorans TaxID=1614 RepID=A0AAE6TWR8_9LACO|nr:class I SAM-dependent methyltransferase [Fructilactobacillus fructivorans]KRK58556.1 putative methyltransferase (putative) [Fructilactobacillus fructivorans]KRN40110.1 putative methyltransferase (putative) [Fructilactobacillus fructivorans]KRN42537.1 putative methyltransferase (putative) [Fructilactobacillus fructivorans]QFX92563.1 methyltransferase domain-containing protein [Fructilactobacillus fructivorans]RDV65842.1 class I SAM-dependent methyltransferase [Fructilactobacillus fructivoran
MIYGEFASFYDELFDNELYKKWCNFVVSNVPKSARILDLACGTGRLLVQLKNAGYQVAGADLSDDMLAIANDHLNENGIFDVELINANMLDLDGLPKYGAITCFDDSICYLANIDQVMQMFAQVRNHLSNDGKFLFDVITPYQTDIVYPGYMFNTNDGDRAFMWNTFIGNVPHSVEHDLSFFDYNHELDAFDEYNETHKERTYSLIEYQDALKSAGFNNVRVSSDFGNDEVHDDTTRWFFVCSEE